MANTKKRTEETVEKIRAKVRANKPATENLVTNESANNNIETADKATLKFNSSISEPDYLKTLYGQVRIGMTCQSPSDNENLLSTPKNCLKVFETIFPLLEILNSFSWCGKPIKNKFYEAIKQWDEMPLNLDKNILGASIQGELGIILVESAQLINHFLIQNKFNLDEFKNLIHETKNSLDLIENDFIKTKDVNDILEGISRIFPEIKFTQFKQSLPVIAPRLFEKSNLNQNSSSRVMDIFFCICVSKSLPFTKIGEAIQTTKKYTNGDINLIFREAIEDSLIRDFGIDTYKIFNLLVCYWYDNLAKSLDNNLTVSVNDLLDYAKRKNKVVKETETGKTKKLTKEINYAWIAHHIDLLKSVRVYSPKIVPTAKGKKAFAISETPLIEFSELTYSPSQLDINGNRDFSNVQDILINFKIGKWFEYFNSEKHLIEFGYCHKEAIASEGNLSHLLNWLSFKLEHNQTGNFKVITILEQIGFKEKLEEINRETNAKKKSDLKRNLYSEFKKLLKDSDSIPDPYQWEYQNHPQWLLDDTLTKPRGKWWEIFLNTVIVFKHPECLIGEGKEFKREQIKPIKALPEAKPIKTTEDLKFVMTKFNISIRDLVKKSETKYTYYKLQKSLKDDILKESEIRQLITYCYQINQERKN